MAKQGQIAGIGIAHREDTEHLKPIPNCSENDNLGNCLSVSPDPKHNILTVSVRPEH